MCSNEADKDRLIEVCDLLEEFSDKIFHSMTDQTAMTVENYNEDFKFFASPFFELFYDTHVDLFLEFA